MSHPEAIVLEYTDPRGAGTSRFTMPWQSGPVGEVGINGVQADDVLDEVLVYLRAVNAPPYGSRETSLAITNIEQGAMWLRERTRQREARGVEGTSQP